jgi:type IV secretion system protein VirB5
MFAFFCLVLSFSAIGGMAYVGSKSKFVPMVVEVDRLGQAVAVKALNGDEAIADPKRHAYAEMFELIENLRTVTTDRKANNSLIEKGFSRLTGSARTYARDELRKNPPNDVGASKTVQPIVRTALPLGGKTWQIDWEERSFNLQGEDMGTEYWRATVQYTMNPSEDEKVFRRNPAGFYVSEMSWQKIIK